MYSLDVLGNESIGQVSDLLLFDCNFRLTIVVGYNKRGPGFRGKLEVHFWKWSIEGSLSLQYVDWQTNGLVFMQIIWLIITIKHRRNIGLFKKD